MTGVSSMSDNEVRKETKYTSDKFLAMTDLAGSSEPLTLCINEL